MKKKHFAAVIVFAIIMVIPLMSFAWPNYLTTFNKKYLTTATVLNTCKLCHATATGGALNPYGTAVKAKLLTGLSIGAALTKVQPLDSDKDTFKNIVEIKARTFPGKAKSKPPVVAAEPANGASQSSAAQGNVQTSVTVVNTYAQHDYATITFDQVDPGNYRYVRVKSDGLTIGQTEGYTSDDGDEAGGMETTFPLGAWDTMEVEVYDTGTVKVFLDGSPKEFLSFDF